MPFSRKAFSLFEVLVVLGLIAIASSLVVVNAEAILRGFGTQSLDKVLRDAVREARFLAASQKDTTTLRFDPDSGSFLIHNANGALLATFDSGYGEDAQSVDVRFAQRLPASGTDFDRDPPTTAIDTVFFRPDRSSTPFDAEISLPDGDFSLRFDPFSDVVLHDSRER